MQDNLIRINIDSTNRQLQDMHRCVNSMRYSPFVTLFLSLGYEKQRDVRKQFNGDNWGLATSFYNLGKISGRIEQLMRIISLLDNAAPALPLELMEEVAAATLGIFNVEYANPDGKRVTRVDISRMIISDWDKLLAEYLLKVAPDEVNAHVAQMGMTAAGKSHERVSPFEHPTGMSEALKTWAQVWYMGYDKAIAEGYVHPSTVERADHSRQPGSMQRRGWAYEQT